MAKALGDSPRPAPAICIAQRHACHLTPRSVADFDAESGNNWGVHGRGYYIANRLLWNPDADVTALLADFYEKAFGPAAPAMKRYYERVAPDGEPLMSRGLIGEAFRDALDPRVMKRE